MSALAGGDCIDDADALRAGGTERVLSFSVRAPSTLDTFLRSFRWGHVRQLDRVSRELLARASRGAVCVPLVQAPDTAPVLRARHLPRAPELLPAPEPVDPDPQAQPPSAASASRAGRPHPWRLYPAVRRKPR